MIKASKNFLSNLRDVNFPKTVGNDTKVIGYDHATETFVPVDGGGTPGGSDTQVQHNDSGAFSGDSGFTYDGNGTATLSTALVTEAIKPAINSIAAVQIQDAAGGNVLNIDTTNGRVAIGLANPTYAFEVVDTSVNLFKLRRTSSNNAICEIANSIGSWYWGVTRIEADLGFGVSNSLHSAALLTLTREGDIGIDTVSPTAKLDINGDSLRLRTSKTPASASATGNQGDIAWDSSYIYVCTATDTWKRTALATW